MECEQEMETKKIFLIKDPSQYEYLRERKITKGSRRPPKQNVLKVEPSMQPKISPLRCPGCNNRLYERKSVGGYVCKNWRYKNYWKYGKGPVFAKFNEVR